jgi:hypothetical protein
MTQVWEVTIDPEMNKVIEDVLAPFRRLVSLLLGQRFENRYPSGRGPTNEQLNAALFGERP